MNRRKRAASELHPAPRSTSVVVIGSYREDLAGLLAFCRSLVQLGLRVLHPPPQAYRIGEELGFVRLDSDCSLDQGQVQRHVFTLLDSCDAVILYSPKGRVGVSAALEIGYALHARKPIYATARPEDVTVRALLSYEPSALTDFLRAATAADELTEYAELPRT
jgi:nucleoside 2-deoxyribosyltransferase